MNNVSLTSTDYLQMLRHLGVPKAFAFVVPHNFDVLARGVYANLDNEAGAPWNGRPRLVFIEDYQITDFHCANSTSRSGMEADRFSPHH